MRHYFQTDRSTELLNVENKRRAQRLVTIGLLVSSTTRRISLQRASMGRKITLQNPQNIACVSPLKRESSLMQIHTGLLSIVGFVRDTLKKAENATVVRAKLLIFNDLESAPPNFSVFP